MRHKLPKTERLSRTKFIKKLFAKGGSFNHYPIRVIFLELKPEQAAEAVRPVTSKILRNPPKAQVVFAVPKRNVRKAVNRNLVKRRMKEAYRLNKQLLSDADANFLIAFLYIGKEIHDFQLIEEKLKSILLRLRRSSHSQKI